MEEAQRFYEAVIVCHHGNNSDLTCFRMSVENTPQLLDASTYRFETNTIAFYIKQRFF